MWLKWTSNQSSMRSPTTTSNNMSVDGQTTSTTIQYPYDLGKYTRKITTDHSDAQIWFDRGLIWLYGFNLDEAASCFRKALGLDPKCPMAAWGLAYALGPHYNFQWASQGPKAREANVKKTHDAAQHAIEVANSNNNITAVEIELIMAIQARYPHGEPPETLEGFGDWNRYYADAMHNVYEHYPDDLDVACLYADAMLNLTPWKIWDVGTGTPTEGSRALQAKAVIEKAFSLPGGRTHAGLLHMYIHLMEMSPEPELAVTAANNLRDLAPDCGHLQHMSSHIDVLVGSYDLATKSNMDAVAVDEKYLSRNPLNVYLNYCLHNRTSLIYAAMMAGASKSALEGCNRIEELVTESFLRIPEPNMANFAEAFLATRPHVLVRFGMWREILQLPLPKDLELYTVTIATIQYAKGIAHAALGNIEEAEIQRKRFRISFSKVSEGRLTFPNKSRDVLAVARAMLDGELEYRKGNFDLAFGYLDEAIVLEDKLMYSEPPGWMLPVRHASAALLLEQGHVRRAAELYAEDLGLRFDGKEATLPRPRRHPQNMWALQGYHECLLSLGMMEDARVIENDLKQAKRGADVRITASCFCRFRGVRPMGSQKTKACRI